jgi:hypothetical protein
VLEMTVSMSWDHTVRKIVNRSRTANRGGSPPQITDAVYSLRIYI